MKPNINLKFKMKIHNFLQRLKYLFLFYSDRWCSLKTEIHCRFHQRYRQHLPSTHFFKYDMDLKNVCDITWIMMCCFSHSDVTWKNKCAWSWTRKYLLLNVEINAYVICWQIIFSTMPSSQTNNVVTAKFCHHICFPFFVQQKLICSFWTKFVT